MSVMAATVVSVHRSPEHTFSKPTAPEVELIEGIGVRGDAHAGTTVKHRSRVARNPSDPNLRQVHLMHHELLDDLGEAGFDVSPGELGENLTTSGVALLELPVGTRLSIGEAVLVITGLRNPCSQINRLQPELLKQLVRTTEDGQVERLSGVMSIVARGGVIRPGQEITVDLPPQPHHPLTVV